MSRRTRPPGRRPDPAARRDAGAVGAAPAAPAARAAAATPGPPGRRRWPWLAGLVAATVAAAAVWWNAVRGPSAPAPIAERAAATVERPPATEPGAPAPAADPRPSASAFADSARCHDCHAAQAAGWRESNHALAMAAPDERTVRGDFAERSFRHAGVSTRFSRRDGRYVVRTDGPDGVPADFDVAWTFGVRPLQQYLLATPGGRLQPLQVAWDTERQRWFHLLPHEKAPAGDVLHWTGRYQTANTMCISCHTTGFEKRYDPATDTFASRWHEPNVSCQSCHGPGARHVDWAERQAQGRAPDDGPGERLGLSVDLKRADGPRVVDTCSACHSRRAELVAAPLPGRPRFDQYLPALLAPGLYHADGQQLDEVFVDGSFRQSRMFRMGVGCTDCHEPHRGTLRRAGNATCTHCHGPQPEPRFPSAAGRYDAREHHHHAPGSAGAQCVACHMPAKNYMVVQPRRDHGMRVPRPDLTASLGVPNACADCHVDRDAKWAADQAARWWGTGRRQRPHYGEAFAAARAGRPGADADLVRLVEDATQPGIVRATALSALRGSPAGLGARAAAARDADPEVRAAAADSLEAAPAADRLRALAPLLSDPLRAVRIAAARSLASVPDGSFDPVTRSRFDAALGEYVTAQEASLDMPGPHLNLAVVHAQRGRADLAERHYLAALRIDPDFTPARANLAQLYNAGGRNADAIRVLTDGIAREPTLGELHYSLGLLLAEEGRMAEAATSLAEAARLLPQRARVHYNLGLALQRLGEPARAEQALLAARRLDPSDPAVPHALAVLAAQGGRRDDARRWAQAWAEQAPDDPAARAFLQRVR
jgi:Flp pilus assembly protein TadD